MISSYKTDSFNRKKNIGRLPILLSCRVRLNREQRALLEDAYDNATRGSSPISNTNLDQAFELIDVTMRDVLNNRDTIALPVLLKVQKILGVEVVYESEIADAATKYVDYVFEHFA